VIKQSKSLVTIDGLLMIGKGYYNLIIDRLYRSLILSFLYEEELDVSLASPTLGMMMDVILG
jgi:hypothetical protein